MRRALAIVALAILSRPTQAQEEYSRLRLDSVFDRIPLSSDTIWSLFNWVSKSLVYDTRPQSGSTSMGEHSRSLYDVFSSGRGVCSDYAGLLHQAAHHLGYKAEIIHGYSVVQGGDTSSPGHAWNAIWVKGRWRLFDPTWASGFVKDGVFIPAREMFWYDTDPDSLLKTHFPCDQIWSASAMKSSAHKRMVDVFLSLDTLERTRAVLLGLDTLKVTAQREMCRVEYEELLAHQLAAEGTMRLNAAIGLLNEFRERHARHFREPKWSDELIKAKSDGLCEATASALSIFSEVDRDRLKHPAAFDESVRYAERIDHLAREERDFTTRLLGAWKPIRLFVF